MGICDEPCDIGGVSLTNGKVCIDVEHTTRAQRGFVCDWIVAFTLFVSKIDAYAPFLPCRQIIVVDASLKKDFIFLVLEMPESCFWAFAADTPFFLKAQ